VSFGDAPLHRLASAPNLGSLVLSLLAKHGQQHDPASWREVVRDTSRNPTKVEPQLEEAMTE
jgi:hypothetical protein